MPAETIEHAPPKILFTKSHRPAGLEVPACKRCNNGSSSQDQVAAYFCLMQAVALFDDNSGLSDEYASLLKTAEGVFNNQPALKAAFQHAGQQVFQVSGKAQSLTKYKINDCIFENYLEPWAAKQVLAYWYAQTGKCASNQTNILVRWTTLHELSNSEDLVSMVQNFPDITNLAQGKWDTSQQFFVKHTLNPEEGLGMFFFAYHSGVSFYAALVDNAAVEMEKFMSSNNQFAALKTNEKKGIHRL